MAEVVDASQLAQKPSVLPAALASLIPLGQPGSSVQGPPAPPDFTQPQAPKDPSLPPEVGGAIGELPETNMTTGEPEAKLPPAPPDPLGNVTQTGVEDASAPTLAPAPPKQKTLEDKILPFLHLAGVLGGGL